MELCGGNKFSVNVWTGLCVHTHTHIYIYWDILILHKGLKLQRMFNINSTLYPMLHMWGHKRVQASKEVSQCLSALSPQEESSQQVPTHSTVRLMLCTFSEA